MDHLLLPPGASEGLHRHPGIEEVYYVLNGDGQAQVNGETAEIHKGDAVPVLLNEAHSFKNNSSQDLEFMIIGIASQKGVLETVLGGIGQRRRVGRRAYYRIKQQHGVVLGLSACSRWWATPFCASRKPPISAAGPRSGTSTENGN